MFTRIVRGPTRSAGTGNVPSRNQRYAVRGATPCALAHSVRFTHEIIQHLKHLTDTHEHSTASSSPPLLWTPAISHARADGSPAARCSQDSAEGGGRSLGPRDRPPPSAESRRSADEALPDRVV